MKNNKLDFLETEEQKDIYSKGQKAGLKVLLIYPKCPDTFWSFKYALKFIAKKSTIPPLGLITIASMLPHNWETKLVDLNIESLSERNLNWADIVFISAIKIQTNSAREIIKICQERGLKVVAGGPLFTTESSDYKFVDHLVLNEAECSLGPFLDDFARGKPQALYNCQHFPEIKETPCPKWQLVKMKKYDSMCIQYSRGCPYDCEFCDIIVLNGQTPRNKSANQIIKELDSLYDMKWRGSVFFVDDNFIGNKNVLKKELLPALIDWMKKKNYPFNFFTEASINLADDEELMQMMISAGFEKVFIGIETPHKESLIECNKFANEDRDMIASVKKMQNYGFEVQGGFIIGFDNDPHSIFEKQINFIQQSGIVTAMVGLLSAMHGTRLYKRLKKEGRLLQITSGNNTDFSVNFIPKMKIETLIKGYKDVLNAIYSPKEYYKRIRVFFKEFNYKSHTSKSKLALSDIRAFIRSIWRLGIIGRERVYYWKLVFWTLLHHPKLLSKAITFAIFGFHFRKIFKIR